MSLLNACGFAHNCVSNQRRLCARKAILPYSQEQRRSHIFRTFACSDFVCGSDEARRQAKASSLAAVLFLRRSSFVGLQCRERCYNGGPTCLQFGVTSPREEYNDVFLAIGRGAGKWPAL